MEVTFERVALTAHALGACKQPALVCACGGGVCGSQCVVRLPGGCNQVWIELQPVGARVKTAKSRLTETAAVRTLCVCVRLRACATLLHPPR